MEERERGRERRAKLIERLVVELHRSFSSSLENFNRLHSKSNYTIFDTPNWKGELLGEDDVSRCVRWSWRRFLPGFHLFSPTQRPRVDLLTLALPHTHLLQLTRKEPWLDLLLTGIPR